MSKTAFSIFAGSEMCLPELHKASTVVEMALSDHPGTETDLYALLSHSSHENCFVDPFSHLNRLARTTQDFQSCENCFLCHSWHLNRPPRASQDLYCGEHGIVGPSPHLNKPVGVTQHLQSVENCFLDLS